MIATPEAVREHLNQGDIEITGRLVDASNATLFGTCTYKDRAIDVIYKPIAGERPLWDFPDGNLASREYASHLISELAQWNIVPMTVLRNGPFGEGMVQQWIDIDDSVDLAEFYRTDDVRLRQIALFDVVINNTDRKIGHLLPTTEGHVYGCDHGVTFHCDFKLRTVLWQWAGKQLRSDEISTLQDLLGKIRVRQDLFGDLISTYEYQALITRIEGLLSEGVFPSPSEDWPAIPWPPF